MPEMRERLEYVGAAQGEIRVFRVPSHVVEPAEGVGVTVPPAVDSWARVDEILARPPVVPVVDGQLPAFDLPAQPAPVSKREEEMLQLGLFG